MGCYFVYLNGSLFITRLLVQCEINSFWSLASGMLQMYIMVDFWELCPTEMRILYNSGENV